MKWDLRVAAAAAAAAGPWRAAGGGSGGGGGGGFFGGGGNNGPFVLPGTYRATLTVDGKDVADRSNVAVKGDPGHQDHRRRSQGVVRHRDGPAAAAGQGERSGRDGAESPTRSCSMLQQQTRNADAVAEREAVARRASSRSWKWCGGGSASAAQGGGGGFGGNTENVRGRIGQLKGAVMG